jgi:hypothetical protein
LVAEKLSFDETMNNHIETARGVCNREKEHELTKTKNRNNCNSSRFEDRKRMNKWDGKSNRYYM